ncbi:histidine-specific methyltransferase [Pavlovales sp. CCMP2436]|nr:histidine-specific methyltransferase [Pavlovales sp. CCMP2436]
MTARSVLVIHAGARSALLARVGPRVGHYASARLGILPTPPSRLHATLAVAAQEAAFAYEPPPLSSSTGTRDERETILDALSGTRPSISCVYLYDAQGSQLFEKICDTEEYYLTRVEDSLLRSSADALLCFSGEDAQRGAGLKLPPMAWVECSAGNGQKVAPLILKSAELRDTTYVPLDVSASALAVNASRFAGLPSSNKLSVCPLVGTNEQGLSAASKLDARKTFMMLGSSLGNYTHPHTELEMIAQHMGPTDRLLVGVDTPPTAEGSGGKTEAEVVAAYNDAQGVTSAFTLNALAHVNRVAGTDFDLADFRHVSEWCPERSAIVAHVEAVRNVRVTSRARVSAAARSDGKPVREVLRLRAGERIFMEQSAKFSLVRMELTAKLAGMRVRRHWMAQRNFYLIVECELEER